MACARWLRQRTENKTGQQSALNNEKGVLSICEPRWIEVN
jgi:hypothetical protein